MKQAKRSCLLPIIQGTCLFYQRPAIETHVAAEMRAKWRNKEKTIPSVKPMMDAVQTCEQNLKC